MSENITDNIENIANKVIEKSDLQKATNILKDCQINKNIDSCYKCDMNIWSDCKIRQNYIDEVYKKMSGGNQGEFDF